MIQENKGATQTAPVTPVKIQITSPIDNMKKTHLGLPNNATSTHQSCSSEAKLKELEEKLVALTDQLKVKVNKFQQATNIIIFTMLIG